MIDDKKFEQRCKAGATKDSLAFAVLAELRDKLNELGIKAIWRNSESRIIFPEFRALKVDVFVNKTGAIMVRQVCKERFGNKTKQPLVVYPYEPQDPKYDPIPALIKAVEALHTLDKAFAKDE